MRFGVGIWADRGPILFHHALAFEGLGLTIAQCTVSSFIEGSGSFMVDQDIFLKKR